MASDPHEEQLIILLDLKRFAVLFSSIIVFGCFCGFFVVFCFFFALEKAYDTT